MQDGGRPLSWKISTGHISATGHPTHIWFQGEDFGSADRMDLLPVEPNPIAGRTPSSKISNECICGGGAENAGVENAGATTDGKP